MSSDNSSGEEDSLAPSRKIIVKFDRHGSVIGSNATHFQRRMARFVRTFVPIRYLDWRHVPRNYKDDVWNCILREFDVPSVVRYSVELTMPDVFRRVKNKLRYKYLDKCPNMEAQILNIPPRIKKEDWVQFCINENSDKHKKMRERNARNRKSSVHGHTGGRKSYAMVLEEMREKQEDPTILLGREDAWLENHMRRDGTSLPTAASRVEEVKAKMAEIRQSEGRGDTHPLSIDNDALTQVFGKDSRGRVRGVGSHVSKSRYNACLPGHIVHSEERLEKDVLTKKYDLMVSKLDQLNDAFYKFVSQSQTSGGTLTPLTPVMVNPTRGEGSGEGNSVNSMTSRGNETAPTARLCELLEWEENCVAIAQEVTDPIHRGNCHGYVLDPLIEVKVSMVTRKIWNARLYKAEKNPDAKKIGDVGVGDFLVWPKTHTRFDE